MTLHSNLTYPSNPAVFTFFNSASAFVLFEIAPTCTLYKVFSSEGFLVGLEYFKTIKEPVLILRVSDLNLRQSRKQPMLNDEDVEMEGALNEVFPPQLIDRY